MRAVHRVWRGIAAVVVAVLATVLFVAGVVVADEAAFGASAGAAAATVESEPVVVEVTAAESSDVARDDASTPYVVLSGLFAVALLVVVALADAWRSRVTSSDGVSATVDAR